MKTKEVYVSNDGTGRDEALEVVEQYSFSRDFDKKPRLHARLLAEELLGMVSEITGKFYAYFWVEDNDTAYMLHLSAQSEMNTKKYDMLLDSSTSGKNSAVKGIMGKIRNAFEYYWKGYKEGMDSYGLADYDSFLTYGINSDSMAGSSGVWTLTQYRTAVVNENENNEYSQEWDELERSIIANLADDVSVGIKGDKVEIIITKKYEQ